MIGYRNTCLAAIISLSSVSICIFADISEAHFRSKYPFAAEKADTSRVISHSDGIHSIYLNPIVRECDIEDGNVILLAFYKNSTLLKSYTLRDIFPDPDDWEFHPASGAFAWIWYDSTTDVYPKTDGLRGDTFSLNSHRRIQIYNFTTGDRIETEAEQGGESNGLKPVRWP